MIQSDALRLCSTPDRTLIINGLRRMAVSQTAIFPFNLDLIVLVGPKPLPNGRYSPY